MIVSLFLKHQTAQIVLSAHLMPMSWRWIIPVKSPGDKLREPKDTRVGVQLFHWQQYHCESGFLDAVHVGPGIGRHDIVFRLEANGAVHQRLPRPKAGTGREGVQPRRLTPDEDKKET